jgi:hypothetical protein
MFRQCLIQAKQTIAILSDLSFLMPLATPYA